MQIRYRMTQYLPASMQSQFGMDAHYFRDGSRRAVPFASPQLPKRGIPTTRGPSIVLDSHTLRAYISLIWLWKNWKPMENSRTQAKAMLLSDFMCCSVINYQCVAHLSHPRRQQASWKAGVRRAPPLNIPRFGASELSTSKFYSSNSTRRPTRKSPKTDSIAPLPNTTASRPTKHQRALPK